jgi:hypothetical protein
MNKIDLIIDALQKAKDGWQCFDEYEKALAAARELRALKPVAWCSLAENGRMNYSSGQPMIMIHQIDHEPNEYMQTRLYALDEVKK